MKPYDIVKAAQLFDILPFAAMQMRVRFLRERVGFYLAEPACAVALHFAVQDIRAVVDLEKRIKEHKCIKNREEITDEMIERARSTPIETIIEFERGVARCLSPKHEDKNPSMYHGKRTNHAICGGCGEKFDAIAAYMAVWGTDFKTTVKRLQ